MSDENNPFHPNNIGQQWAVVPAKIRRRRGNFTMVPGIWKEQLTKARHIATYRIVLHILMRDWESGGEPFTLSNGALALENVSRRQKWRALEELEQLGLIVIERRKRKSPLITALHTATTRKGTKVQP
jgi:hypothetical protein